MTSVNVSRRDLCKLVAAGPALWELRGHNT